MANISFNVDAYTARLIGRENVSKLNGAVIELIKNTYDADASICILCYEQNNETLYILDNGDGMNEDIIKKHWMTIGRSTKKSNYRSKNGRVQTGAKGIGRFALDRIADVCEMYTASSEGNRIWKVNWEDFEKKENITDVTAELYEPSFGIESFISDVTNSEVRNLFSLELEKRAKIRAGIKTGTIFKLSFLRDSWDSQILQKIKNDLMTLIPYERKNEFQVYVFNSETSLQDATVLTGDDSYSYDYKISFDVSEIGKIKIDMHRNEFDFGKDFNEIMNEANFSEKDREYFKGKHIIEDFDFSTFLQDDVNLNTIGTFSGVFYFEKITQMKADKEIYYYKPELKNNSDSSVFGGIRVYRDDFRVRPYGEPNTSSSDWLQLSSRKQKSPASPSHPNGAWRTAANQITGSVFISRLNMTLPDQSNREGIVETKEFILFKEFIIKVIQYFERDRQYVFRKLRSLYDEKNEAIRIQEEIELKAQQSRELKEAEEVNESNQQQLSISLKSANESNTSITAVEAKIALDFKDSLIKDLEDENRLLRTLATTGIVTNSYVHEMKDNTNKIGLKMVLAQEELEFDRNIDGALKYLKEANDFRDSLNSWFNVTIGTVSRDKRTMKKVDLKSSITKMLSSWEEILPVEISYKFNRDEIYLKCFEYDIDSIFSNLISNSVASFETNYSENKKITINIIDAEQSIIIEYSDSGKGLSQSYRKNPDRILEAMESDKRNKNGETIGTGMGMWIIQRIVADYKGKIDLSMNDENAEGFSIKIKLLKR